MVTIAGDKFAGLSTSFDNSRSFGELVPDAVDLYVEKWYWVTHNRLALVFVLWLGGGVSVLRSICLELVTEFRDKALRRPGAGFTESTDGSPGDIVRDRLQCVRVTVRATPIEQTSSDFLHPKRSFPARR